MNKKTKIYRHKYRRRMAKYNENHLTCLVVVDMQPDFPASLDRRFNNKVWDRIRTKIEQKQVIVFLNYLITQDDGKKEPTIGTYDENNIILLDEYLYTYPNKVLFLRKNSDDGSQIVHESVMSAEIIDRIRQFEIIGVNTEYCVVDTAIGLSQKYPEKEIIINYDVCNTLQAVQKGDDAIMEKMKFKLITAMASNVKISRNDCCLVPKFTSEMCTEVRKEYEDEYKKQVENATKNKSGDNTSSFIDTSLDILILTDEIANELIESHDAGNTASIYCKHCILNHPNYAYRVTA